MKESWRERKREREGRRKRNRRRNGRKRGREDISRAAGNLSIKRSVVLSEGFQISGCKISIK